MSGDDAIERMPTGISGLDVSRSGRGHAARLPAGRTTAREFGAGAGQAIVSASADGIVAVDTRGVIRICNPAAEELFGRPAKELIGTQFGHPIVVGGATEVELMLPDGTARVAEMRVTSTILESERLHVASLRDITRRRRIERDLEEALERQHAMAAVVVHELRNPLATISTLTHALRDPAAMLTPEQRDGIIDRIAERTSFLQALVKKLVTASRIDVNPPRSPVERVPVLELTLERLAEFGERTEDVRVSCPPGLAALVNRCELSEMLVNCLENAFAYGRPPIEVRAVERPDRVEIMVSDSGPGVPEEFVPRLFDRFTREPGVEQRTEGSGLGLWIVRSLAQANGGDVRYEPAEGGGACFRISLRRA